MFDFEKLDVNKKAKIFNSVSGIFIKNTRLDSTTRDQLRRAAFSIVLNQAEGSWKFLTQIGEISNLLPEIHHL